MLSSMVFVLMFLYTPVANFSPRLRDSILEEENWKMVGFRTISGRPMCFHLLSSLRRESFLDSLWECVWLKFFIISWIFWEILFVEASKTLLNQEATALFHEANRHSLELHKHHNFTDRISQNIHHRIINFNHTHSHKLLHKLSRLLEESKWINTSDAQKWS